MMKMGDSLVPLLLGTSDKGDDKQDYVCQSGLITGMKISGTAAIITDKHFKRSMCSKQRLNGTRMRILKRDKS